MTIDWSRVAKPQPDGYDSQVLAHLLGAKGWTRLHASERADVTQTLVNGSVAVVQDPFKYGSNEPFGNPPRLMVSTQATEEELRAIEQHLSLWPDGQQAIEAFLDEFWPKRMLLADGTPLGRMRGCSSGHRMIDEWNDAHRRTAAYVTVEDPQGCAAGIVHEVFHMRLETVGMHIEQHDGALIENTVDELYDSPFRTDRPRPMSAVIHGLAAWIALTENDIRCAEHFKDQESFCFMETNVPKIVAGLTEVRQHARPTAAGELFLGGLLAWGDDVAARGSAHLPKERA